MDMETTVLTDDQLRDAVLQELDWEPSVAAAQIGVTAHDGAVTLSGHVKSYAEKHAAETAARRVKGLRTLAEEIEVTVPLDIRPGDEDIVAAAVDRLAWDASLPDDAVEVTVEKGWVTLTGQVAWYYQKEAAEAEIRTLFGVCGISNQIGIKPAVHVQDIEVVIRNALDRSSFFEPKTIEVTAFKGRIRLSGSVRSWHDRSAAEAVAWQQASGCRCCCGGWKCRPSPPATSRRTTRGSLRRKPPSPRSSASSGN